jgi:hypothetical protein
MRLTGWPVPPSLQTNKAECQTGGEEDQGDEVIARWHSCHDARRSAPPRRPAAFLRGKLKKTTHPPCWLVSVSTMHTQEPEIYKAHTEGNALTSFRLAVH